VIKYLFKNKFIVRPMKIDNDDKYIRATLGSSKIMKKFTSKLKLALELK
jgi:histidinol-phosphate/aromatic aminotransferase/cobyric acid decarboxylase-like protein